MSADAIDSWIEQCDAEAILTTLRAHGDADADDARALITWLRAIGGLEDEALIEKQLDALTTAKVLGGSKKARDSIRATLVEENLGRFRNLPGDAMFLHSVGGHLCEGYVAYLRRITNIDEEEVALRFHDLGDRTKRAKRISRLTSPYVFRLTQQLGQVFATIGLPGSYEASRDRFITHRAAYLSPHAE